ncbi:MAG TPA: porin, partial [Azonexus sp.]|nr:porin [Azonexus sp.]
MQHTKKLATLAAACLFPILAQAQSNVTIFGLLDVNLAQERANGLKRNALDTSELNGSRLGFKGSEDMGNGLKAIFMLESAVAIDTGTSTGFTRQSYLGLEGSFGRVTFGRQYSPAFVAIDPYEATGSSDRSAGMLHRKSGSVARGYQVRFDN